MGACPGGITIASSAQNETICSTSCEVEAAADHAASTRSSSACALSIFRLSFNRILLHSWPERALISIEHRKTDTIAEKKQEPIVSEQWIRGRRELNTNVNKEK